jgi:hypothetical protein
MGLKEIVTGPFNSNISSYLENQRVIKDIEALIDAGSGLRLKRLPVYLTGRQTV